MPEKQPLATPQPWAANWQAPDWLEKPLASARSNMPDPSTSSGGVGPFSGYVPPAAQNPVPTLPSTAAADAGLGKTDVNAVAALFGASPSGISDQDIQRALTPISQRGPIGLPTSMQRPIAPFQGAPMNQQPVVGAGNARARGIGNAITGAMNAVGSFVNARAQQVQDQHAQSVSKFLQAQASADQAKSIMDQVGENGIGYTQAKATYDQNQALQKKMLEDDKFRKVLEKGMNISLTDPSKNKTPDHQSFIQGMLHFKKQQGAQAQPQAAPDSSAMLQRFGQQMPTQLGPNQMAQQALQYKMAQQNAYQKMLQSLLPRAFTAQSQGQLQDRREAATNARQLQQQAYTSWLTGQKFDHDVAMAGAKHDFKLNEIGYEQNLLGNRLLDLYNAENYSPAKIYKLQLDQEHFFANAEGKYNTAMDALKRDLAADEAAIHTAVFKKDSDAAQALVARDNAQIQSLTDQIAKFQEYKQTVYGNLRSLAGFHSGGTSNAGVPNAAAGAPGVPPAAGGGSVDPNTFLYDPPIQYGTGSPNSGIVPNLAIPPIAGAGGASGDDEGDDESTAGSEP